MGGVGWVELLLILLIPLLLLVVLASLGFFLPPPKRRPDGVIYWISLSLFFLFILSVVALLIGVSIQEWQSRQAGGKVLTFVVLGILLGLALALLANTFWAKGMARKLPEGMDEEERREAIGSLSRRLWWPLAGLVFLLVAPFILVGIPTLISVVKASARAPVPVPPPPPSPSAP